MSTRGDWQEVLTDATTHRALSNWELTFVWSIIGRNDDYELSVKQEQTMRQIETKIYQTG